MQPSASRDRSTITVTALSFDAFFEGRQIVGPRSKRSARGVIDPDRAHATDPLGPSDQGRGRALKAVPGRHPGHPETAGDRRDGGVVVTQRADRPVDRAGAELGPRGSDGVLLGPRQPRACSTPLPPLTRCAIGRCRSSPPDSAYGRASCSG